MTGIDKYVYISDIALDRIAPYYQDFQTVWKNEVYYVYIK